VTNRPQRGAWSRADDPPRCQPPGGCSRRGGGKDARVWARNAARCPLRSRGFRAAGNRRQDAPSAEGASRRVIRLRSVTRSTRGPAGANLAGGSMRRVTARCPYHRRGPSGQARCLSEAKIPCREEQDGPGWRPPSRAVRDEGVPAGAGVSESSPILQNY